MNLGAFTNESSLANAGRLPFYDTSAAGNRDCALSDLLSYIKSHDGAAPRETAQSINNDTYTKIAIDAEIERPA